MKKCFKCKKKKSKDHFYKHPKNKDGLLGKCKECCKKDATENRNKNIEKVREYDRKRGNRHGPNYTKEYRKKYPNKYRAQTMVGNAVRDNKLFREPCEVCGTENNVHAHHDDYLKPLNIRWLCAAHHHQWHAKHGEAKNP